MKGIKIKGIILLVLVILTFLSLNLTSATVTIVGKGRGTMIYYGPFNWKWECDNSTDSPCTLTVHLQ
jgi:hypothetical protein